MEFVVQELDALPQIIQFVGFNHPMDSSSLSRPIGGT
jgi:hypothetical protein